MSRPLHMTSRGHLKKDLVQTDKLYLSQFQVCPATMTNATFEEFKGRLSLCERMVKAEWPRKTSTRYLTANINLLRVLCDQCNDLYVDGLVLS